MDKVRLWEKARDQVTEMTNPSEETGVSTNAVRAKKAYGKTCFSCGRRVTSLMIEIVLRREGSVQNVKNMAISLVVARMDLSSILPRQTL